MALCREGTSLELSEELWSTMHAPARPALVWGVSEKLGPLRYLKYITPHTQTHLK